jgi:Flp pilus assembly protein TadG
VSRWWRRRTRSSGQALVEFTFVIPVFLAVVLGIVEGSYYAVATVAVNHATHEGARYGVLETTTNVSDIQTRVRAAADPVATLGTTDITLRLNGSTCNEACYDAREAGDRLTVVTNFDHRPISSYIFPGLVFPADAQAELWVEL